MDNQSALNNQQPAINNEPEKKKHPLTALAFMEIGLFEVFFVATVLLLIFGALNYFSILPVSETFPKFLSWLPKKHTQINNNAYNDFLKEYYGSKGKPTPTPIPITQTEKVTVLLYDFTSKSLSSSIAPSMSDIVLKQDNVETGTFAASWTKETGTSSATLALALDETISYLYINNVYNIDSKTIISSQLAKEVVPIFFSIKLQGEWKCKPIHENTYCENFWEENGVAKKGVSISGPFTLSDKQTIVTVSMCEFSKKSPLYSRKSCTTEFADTGVN